MRGSGLAWDLRRAQPYECYDEFDFEYLLAITAIVMIAI